MKIRAAHLPHNFDRKIYLLFNNIYFLNRKYYEYLIILISIYRLPSKTLYN